MRLKRPGVALEELRLVTVVRMAPYLFGIEREYDHSTLKEVLSGHVYALRASPRSSTQIHWRYGVPVRPMSEKQAFEPGKFRVSPEPTCFRSTPGSTINKRTIAVRKHRKRQRSPSRNRRKARWRRFLGRSLCRSARKRTRNEVPAIGHNGAHSRGVILECEICNYAVCRCPRQSTRRLPRNRPNMQGV